MLLGASVMGTNVIRTIEWETWLTQGSDFTVEAEFKLILEYACGGEEVRERLQKNFPVRGSFAYQSPQVENCLAARGSANRLAKSPESRSEVNGA